MKIQKFKKLLDLNTLTEDEKAKYVAELKREAFLCSQMEATAKLELVSIYGALGNENYAFYNPTIAEAITLQGQDAIKYSEQKVTKYFKEDFHNDRELLRILGVPDDVIIQPITGEVVVYCDTDSNYCTFEEIRKKIKWKGDGKELVLLIYNHRLEEYFKQAFKDYTHELNGMGYYLDFELETISSIGLFIAKKKYIHSVVWKDKVNFEDFSKLKVTGLEIVQRSTPIFCRDYLKNAVKQILQVGGLSNTDDTFINFVQDLRNIKQAYLKASLENICKTNKVSNYQKFVIDDTENLVFAPKAPIHIKAAATYNHFIRKHNLTEQYPLLTSGDSVKWYYTKSKQFPVFGFLAGSHPSEIAPKFDYIAMFEKTFVDVINRFVKAMLTYSDLDYSLNLESNLF